MTADRSCPICTAPAHAATLPVSVRRAGQTVLELEVVAWLCEECGYVDIDDAVREALIATLEAHSRPGDDIVFPIEER
jgi:hypothetical protein